MIDIGGVKSLLKPECAICDIDRMVYHKCRCDNCPFIKNSVTFTKYGGKRTRWAAGVKFRKYGLENYSDIGKCQLFYFIYHPELNFPHKSGTAYAAAGPDPTWPEKQPPVPHYRPHFDPGRR